MVNGNGSKGSKLHFQLKKLTVANDDIVVIKVQRDDLPGGIRERLLVQLRQVFPKNELLMIGSNMNIGVMPKKTLNAMGWFKKGQEETREAQKFVGVEAEIERMEVKTFVVEQSQIFAASLKARLNKELPEMNLDVRVETYIRKM